MNQQSVYEKSLLLTDSTDVNKQLLICCIIYSAQYYPLQSQWLNNVINKCLISSEGKQALIESIQQLTQDLNRQFVYGPTATYVTPHDQPHHEYLNTNFIRQQNNQLFTLKIEQLRSSLFQLSLNDLISEQEIEQLLWYRRSNYLKLAKFINKQISKEILQELEVNGQSWTKSVPVPTLLLTLQSILRKIKEKNTQIKNKACLMLGRMAFQHNKILQNPAKALADEALSNYRIYIKQMNNQKELDLLSYVQILLEYAQVLVFYYKYQQCERILQFTKEVTNLELEFTGKLGRRTKFQSFDTPQLIMNLKEKNKNQPAVTQKTDEESEIDKQAIDMPNAKQLILKEIEVNEKNQGIQIDISNFDDENILLERPKLVEEEQKTEKQIPIQKILVALASIQYMWDTSPKEETLFQQINTSIQTILDYKQNNFSYPIMSNILLIRSLNQFLRVKTVERALDQLEKIRNNFNQKTEKDTRFLYSTSYITQLEFIKILAQKYMEIGMTMTAIELYQKVGMLEQCMDGLISKSYKEKALSLAQKYQKQYGKTPRLLCILGDLQEGDKSIPYYEQAWEISGKRNARSQRSLGWLYLSKKQYQKAIQAFKKATQANFYHPNTWFTLGVCYMKLNDFKRAIPAFGECVCIDQTQGQAWGNIASCYIYQKRFKEAFSTLQQALKHSQRNWKLWSNMLSVSLKLKKFYKYFEAIEQLVNINKAQVLNPQMLSKLASIFQYQQEFSERRRPIHAMKNRLDRLFTFLIQKIGQNPMVWHSIYQYNLELEHYLRQNYQHYKKLHEQQKIDKNDLLQGYETLEETNRTINKGLVEIKQSILSSKQTELNMIMKVGWDSNKPAAEEVLKVLQQYIKVFEKYANLNHEPTVNEFKLFINGVRKKLQHCLERNIELKTKIA